MKKLFVTLLLFYILFACSSNTNPLSRNRNEGTKAKDTVVQIKHDTLETILKDTLCSIDSIFIIDTISIIDSIIIKDSNESEHPSITDARFVANCSIKLERDSVYGHRVTINGFVMSNRKEQLFIESVRVGTRNLYINISFM